MGTNSHSQVFAPPTSLRADGKKSLIGLDLDELREELNATLNLPAFRAKQLWNWIYFRGATDFDQMTNLSKSLRADMAQIYSVARPDVSLAQQSVDGTHKWLLKMRDGREVECVHIPEEDRGSLCVSSQVGCTLTCRFCHTGTQKLVRNLSAEEILAQILHCRDAQNEWPSGKPDALFTNIVMMGMGEPLYNYENVAKALKIVMHDEGINISRRKITLSTSGVVPMIERCGQELGVNLAVSLHAVTNDTRSQIMPINKKYPIEELLHACRHYYGASSARRITFEYVLLKGVNDSDADARELARLLSNIPSKINLIPFNPWPGSAFECSSEDRIKKFRRILMDKNYICPVRKPRGRDILAACGQLKSASERLKKENLDSQRKAQNNTDIKSTPEQIAAMEALYRQKELETGAA